MVAISFKGCTSASLPCANKPSTPAVRRSIRTGSLRYCPVALRRRPLSPGANTTACAAADALATAPPARTTMPCALEAEAELAPETRTLPSLKAKRASIAAARISSV